VRVSALSLHFHAALTHKTKDEQPIAFRRSTSFNLKEGTRERESTCESEKERKRQKEKEAGVKNGFGKNNEKKT
jgi:hypothetical protein